LIKAETAQRMRARFGDVLTDGSIAEKAMASLHKAVGHPGHERCLAAEQVVATGCLHHQPVFTVQGNERRETHHPGGKGRQGLQICRAVDFPGEEVRQGCFRIGEAQARFDAHGTRRRICGHDTQSVSGFFVEDKCAQLNRPGGGTGFRLPPQAAQPVQRPVRKPH
jgi:hypothetical protein